MNAKELRIGNMVRVCIHGKAIKIPTLDIEVQSIDFGIIGYGNTPHKKGWSVHCNDAYGIALKPTHLETLGFVPCTGVSGFYLEKSPENGMKSFRVYLGECGVFLGFYGTKIDHVHQLQNLFFAITGEELGINLPNPNLP